MTPKLRLIAALAAGAAALASAAVAGRLVSRPSDDTGERPVGDGLLVLP